MGVDGIGHPFPHLWTVQFPVCYLPLIFLFIPMAFSSIFFSDFLRFYLYFSKSLYLNIMVYKVIHSTVVFSF